MLSPSRLTTGNRAEASSNTASVTDLADFSIEKSEPILPCYMIPLNRNQGFFGRDVLLKELEATLYLDRNPISSAESDSERQLRTFAICGSGGMGKTQLALEFAHRAKSRFDAVFWIHADEQSKLEDGYKQIAITLGLIPRDSTEGKDAIRDLVLGWLANPQKSYKNLESDKADEASWLLILDNVDDPDVLDKFWPTDSPGSVLLTSRDPWTKDYFFSDKSGITLSPFSIEEASQFLLKLTRREKEEEDRQTVPSLAQALNCYPLAIAQIAPVIVRNDLTFNEFLERYEKEVYRTDLIINKLGKQKPVSGYNYSLATVFALDNLRKSQLLLDLIAVLDLEEIASLRPQKNLLLLDHLASLSLDKSNVSGDSVDEQHSSTLDEFPQTIEAYEEARGELIGASLVTRERNKKKVFVHRIVQDVTRSRMSNTRFNKVYTYALYLISTVWPYEEFSFANETDTWARRSELNPHLLKLAKLGGRYEPAAKLNSINLEGPRVFLEACW
jgi:hypothetical protein